MPIATEMELENKAHFAASAFGWWRRDIPSTEAYAYWRDIHGVLAARIPGLFQYRQLHLAPIRTDLGTDLENVETTIPKEEQPNGIAQLLFKTQADIQLFGTHPFVTEYIFQDEQNLVDRNATLWSPNDAARTLKDTFITQPLQGPSPHPTFVIALKKRSTATNDDFRNYVKGISETWSPRPNVLRLRYQLLEPYNQNDWQSPNVEHAWAPEKQYQAWLELVVDQETTIPSLLRATDQNQIIQYIAGLHIFPVFEIYTLVYNGKPTEVGYRGYPATVTIDRVGAANQKDPHLLHALYKL